MARRVCTVCKHLNKNVEAEEEIEIGYLFDGVHSGSPVKIRMCRKHSVELFKVGQKRFLINYRSILFDLVNSDEMEFIKILEKTVRNNLSAIY